MNDGRPIVYFFITMVILMFYWVINSHFKEIEKRENLILELEDTIILQQQAIEIQKRQIELLMQIYLENNSLSPIDRRAI